MEFPEIVSDSSNNSGCPDMPVNGEGSIGDAETSETVHQQVLTLEERLAPGSFFDNLDNAYVLYCEYARLKGFSVKKGTQSYFRKTDIMRMKLYHCSCEGKTDNRATVDKVPKYRKQHYRTDCQAKLRIVRDDIEGPWKVNNFVTTHNHPMLASDESYVLRSSRNLTHAKQLVLETFNAAGIGVGSTFRYMEKEAGGRGNVGFTRKDAYDHMRKVRLVTKIKNYDADELLNYFQAKSLNEPYFFWKVRLDDEGRLMHFFFRDCRSADDYKSFGDVISVDTTFKTNKYNLICAPIIGLNHHRQNILFGIAFLSDETTQTFEWLFKTFLESMEGIEPGIIMTDQDQALVNAIGTTFTDSTHRLCQWHISQNAPTHFGKLNNDAGFREMWFRCMNGCESEREFEETWNSMLRKYALTEHSWFANMYTIRAMWADVFVNDKFTAGLRATSRSEVTNRVIKDLCASSSSLSEFVKHYEGIINDWRAREREEDAANYGRPGQRVDDNRLLKHAAEIYTRNVYHKLEKEAISCLSVNMISSLVDTAGGDMLFTMTAENDQIQRVVTYNPLSSAISCTCQMLVTHGIFCRHILKVFYTLNIHVLPEQYVLKRWTKQAKDKSPQSWTSHLRTKDRGPGQVFKNTLIRMAYDLGLDVEDNIPLHSVALDKFTAVVDEIRKMQQPAVKVKRSRKKSANTRTPKKFKDPPIPKHGWLPCKRRATVLDKREADRGGDKMKKQTRANTSIDSAQCSEGNTCDSFLSPVEDLSAYTPIHDNTFY